MNKGILGKLAGAAPFLCAFILIVLWVFWIRG